MKNMEYSKKEKEQYLNDLTNLMETGWFVEENLEQYTFYHKEMSLKEFISKGRSIIASSIN